MFVNTIAMLALKAQTQSQTISAGSAQIQIQIPAPAAAAATTPAAAKAAATTPEEARIRAVWNITFLPGDPPVASGATASTIDFSKVNTTAALLATALNSALNTSVAADAKLKDIYVSAVNNSLVLEGKESVVNEARRLLATQLDVPQSQIVLEFDTYQASADAKSRTEANRSVQRLMLAQQIARFYKAAHINAIKKIIQDRSEEIVGEINTRSQFYGLNVGKLFEQSGINPISKHALGQTDMLTYLLLLKSGTLRKEFPGELNRQFQQAKAQANAVVINPLQKSGNAEEKSLAEELSRLNVSLAGSTDGKVVPASFNDSVVTGVFDPIAADLEIPRHALEEFLLLWLATADTKLEKQLDIDETLPINKDKSQPLYMELVGEYGYGSTNDTSATLDKAAKASAAAAKKSSNADDAVKAATDAKNKAKKDEDDANALLAAVKARRHPSSGDQEAAEKAAIAAARTYSDATDAEAKALDAQAMAKDAAMKAKEALDKITPADIDDNRKIAQNQVATALRGDRIAKFVRSGARLDDYLKIGVDAIQNDSRRLIDTPVNSWIESKVLKHQDTAFGVHFGGTSTLAVTSRVPGVVGSETESYFPSEQVSPIDMSSLAPIFAKTAAGATPAAATTALSPLESIALNGVFSQAAKPPYYRKLGTGLHISVNPTVLANGSTARLQVKLDMGVTPDELNKSGAGTTGVPGPVDLVKSSSVQTELLAEAFDIAQISSLKLDVSAPGKRDWSVPILSQILPIRSWFVGPTQDKTVRHEVVVLVKVTILPRAMDLASRYLNSKR